MGASEPVKSALSPADQQFHQEVVTFVEQHWSALADWSDAARIAHWRAALVERGWSVPNWPSAHGGTGWSATRKYLWFRACAGARAPGPQPFTHEVVAQLLFSLIEPAQSAVSDPRAGLVAGWLADIRGYSAEWCLGVQSADLQSTTVHEISRGEFALDGSKLDVSAGADWMCCLVDQVAATSVAPALSPTAAPTPAPTPAPLSEWWAVDLSAPGVVRHAYRRLDGDLVEQIEFQRVQLPAAQRLGPATGLLSPAKLFSEAPALLQRAGWLRTLLDMLTDLVADVTPDNNVQRRLDETAIAIQGLEGMQARYDHAVQMQTQLPFPAGLLALRAEEIFLQLGQLQLDSFGYYALPYPDPLLSDNEGPVGPPQRQQAEQMNQVMQAAVQMRSRLMSIQYDGSAEAVRDRIAVQLGMPAPTAQQAAPESED